MQVTDPACGMSLDSTTAAASEVVNERIYYFCSASCHAEFLAALERYAMQGQKSAGGGEVDARSPGVNAPRFGAPGIRKDYRPRGVDLRRREHKGV